MKLTSQKILLIFAIILSSCQKTPEQNLIELKDDRIRTHAVRLESDRVAIRLNKSIEYIKHYYVNPHYQLPNRVCGENYPDIKRLDTLEFRISPMPIKKIEIYGNHLAYKWAGEVYDEPFYSLRNHISEYHSKPTTETNLLQKFGSEADDSITNWVKSEHLEWSETMSAIIQSIQYNDSADQMIIFEMPTARSVTVHFPFIYDNNTENWEELKYYPYQIFANTFGSEAITIFFDQDDNIVNTWWSGWIE